MWGKKNITWLHFEEQNILACDASSALFLARYLHHVYIHRAYLQQLEVVDLQKYRIVRHPKKIYTVIREQASVPFIFVVAKN